MFDSVMNIQCYEERFCSYKLNDNILRDGTLNTL